MDGLLQILDLTNISLKGNEALEKIKIKFLLQGKEI